MTDTLPGAERPKPRLHVILCSTRPGRLGEPVARWFHEQALAHAAFDARLVDLKAFDLPLLDEPQHPRLQKYEHEHTKRWAASVAAADAFVFVTPEYNFGPPPPLVNALDFVTREWYYKPAGFCSYGGTSGGLRAVQMEKLLLTALKMMPILEAVSFPMIAHRVQEGRLLADDAHATAARAMLDELARWTTALKTLR